MKTVCYVHPAFIQRTSLACVDQYFRARGLHAVFVEGSQFLHVEEPPPVRPPPQRDMVRLHAPVWAWWRA